jgi:hypothetical protein
MSLSGRVVLQATRLASSGVLGLGIRRSYASDALLITMAARRPLEGRRSRNKPWSRLSRIAGATWRQIDEQFQQVTSDEEDLGRSRAAGIISFLVDH